MRQTNTLVKTQQCEKIQDKWFINTVQGQAECCICLKTFIHTSLRSALSDIVLKVHSHYDSFAGCQIATIHRAIP